MDVKQKTIQQEFSLSGIGLHTGCSVNLTFKPAPENSGIVFIRVDLPDKPVVQAVPDNVYIDASIQRCTSLAIGPAVIHTVEHLMSALCGLGITNLFVEIDNIELPGLDGSAIEFFKAIKSAGIKDQEENIDVLILNEPVGVELKGCSIFIVPSKEFKISYALDYPESMLKSQFYSVVLDDEVYEKQIAPCRTFCLEYEAKELQKLGLGKGANYQNTLVIGKDGVIDNKLRFPDECVRHKVLDFIGDLYLLGKPIRGHVYAIKSGHTLNFLLLKRLLKQVPKPTRKTSPRPIDKQGRKVYDINEIMQILPHRYPFLLVDRVIEIEPGRHGIGIKNVTINDNFFAGHFPTRPIMPGVMMVEAMAQVGGVLVLTNEAHRGKVAFFMATDKVKFRKLVVPGDQLVMDVRVIKDKARTAQIRGVASVDGEIVAEADMVFSFTEADFLDE